MHFLACGVYFILPQGMVLIYFGLFSMQETGEDFEPIYGLGAFSLA